MKTGDLYTYARTYLDAKYKSLTEGQNYNKIFKISNGILVEDIKNGCSICIPDVNEDWELVREQVDFMTAINSDKKIKGERYREFHNAIYYFDHYLTLEDINGKWEIE